MPSDSRPGEPNSKKLPTRLPTGGIRSPPTETESPKTCGNSHAHRRRRSPGRSALVIRPAQLSLACPGEVPRDGVVVSRNSESAVSGNTRVVSGDRDRPARSRILESHLTAGAERRSSQEMGVAENSSRTPQTLQIANTPEASSLVMELYIVPD